LTLPNKRQRQSLGKRHTNTRTLGTRDHTSTQSKASIATGQNPSVSVSRGPANPPPVPAYGDKWVKRTYSAVKIATAGSPVDFLQSSFGVPGTFYVDKVQAWNLSSSGVSQITGLGATLKQGLITDLGSDDIVGNDFGTANALASVTFKVPLGHAKAVANTGTGVIVSCDAVSPLANTGGNYLVHLHVWTSI